MIVVAALAVVFGAPAAVATSNPPPKASPLVLGLRADGLPDYDSAFDRVERLQGRDPSLVMWYVDWTTDLIDPASLERLRARGITPLITWEPWNARAATEVPGAAPAEIAAGASDGYLRASARDAAAFGGPLLLRFGHEMNGDWYPWGRTHAAPADYVRAFRHIVSIFRAEGATNVRFVWSPNVASRPESAYAAWFPGDAWVDWVGVDGYNRASRNGRWRSLREVFAPSYRALAALSTRPMMIAETATGEEGGDKGAWMRQALLVDVPRSMPRIRAVVWFSRDKETDWRIDSSASALDAWRRVLDSPLWSGTGRDLAAAPAIDFHLSRRSAHVGRAKVGSTVGITADRPRWR